ncbi:golgin subfamily A member 2-like isoform X2 [Cotesia glomerata]|uniref:golgin subfamily A member 2-like isoform X2 n=1 Tax=Cotesia glomerata TaxID=32391 RepID=UPI001D0084D6|nr:golgin subfamily A member 2-like isoform X2 [Cotesia glomerata]
MNKNEKLLAARQKLREFQLNKQYQEGFHTHQTENVNDGNSQEFEININNHTRLIQNHKQLLDSRRASLNFFEIVEDSVKRNSVDFSDVNENSKISNTAISMSKSSPSIDRISHDNECLLSLPLDNIVLSDDKAVSGTNISQNFLSSSNQPDLSSKHIFDILLDNKITTNSLEINCDSEQGNQVSSEDVPILNELNFQLNQSQSKISNLENLAFTQSNKLNQKCIEEIKHLKKQVQMYSQTTNILITEKADLNKLVSHYQILIENKNQIIKELNREFNSSEHRCNELQNNLLQMQQLVSEIEESHKLLQYNHKNLDNKFNDLEQCNKEQKLEITELQQNLNLKNIDLERLSQEVQENNKILVLAELKLQQLTNKSQHSNLLEDQNQIHTMVEEESSKLHEHLKTFNAEKLEIFNHYENYVKQLLNKCEIMSKDLLKSRTIIENLKEREENLKKLCHQGTQEVESFLSQETNKIHDEYFNEKMNSFLQTQECLTNTLSEKEIEIELLKKEITELQELKNQNIEISKLASALESEQLGASRAISQNQQLKKQLSEMQDAFSTLSNTKVDLTQQLHYELKVNEELMSQLNSLIFKNEQLQNELDKKIAIINTMEIEKSQIKLNVYKENDQTQSCDLINSSEKSQHTLDSQEMCEITNQKLNFDNETVNNDSQIQNGELIKEDNNYLLTTKKINENFGESRETHTYAHDLITEPRKKLETRFKDLMEKVAELTDEKQRLEHLVLQLQGETETIDKLNAVTEKLEAKHLDQLMLSKKSETTEKIIDLMKHITDCQDPCTLEQNFHPCLWCSGKLITV